MNIARCCLLVTLVLHSAASADEDPSGGRYCGIYSLYAAIKAQGGDCELERLIDDRYVSSSLGSTLADLKEAADDSGVFALPMRGMTSGMLRDSQWPVLLHVRTGRRGSPFLHWIVYFGMEGDRAQIVDPPNAPETVSFAEILARWDGVGMIVSSEPVGRMRASRVAWLEQGIFAASSLTVLLVTFGAASCVVPLRHRRGVVGSCAIVATAGACALLYHALAAEGFLGNRNSVATVMTAHHAARLPELSLEELKLAMSQRSPIIIDARLGRDYARRHIPGAFSIPISTTSSERTRLLKGVPLDAEIIVYCQSTKCLWSDELGSDLVFRGFEHVSVYRGGYREWSEAGKE